MVLAMAVLLFHFPAVTAVRNACIRPVCVTQARSEAELARNAATCRTNAITTAQPSNTPIPAIRVFPLAAIIASPKLHPDNLAWALKAEMAAPLGTASDALAKRSAPRADTTTSPVNPSAGALTKPRAPGQPFSAAPKNEKNASAGQPFTPTDGYAPAAQPITYSFVPPTGSIAQLTGPSFSEAFLPPPAFRPPFELPATHRRLWLFLSTAEHSAATYDAWSTRRALAAGRMEADPLMRPFAGSAALYPAMQLVPFGLDYLARRLQRSSGWAHRIWWVPQSAATVTFLFSGSYNVAHTN